MRKPFLWAQRKGWYLRVPAEGGKLQTIRLGDTKQAAYDEWDRLKIAAQNAAQAATVPPVKDEVPVAAIIGLYVAHCRSEARLGRIKEQTVTRRISHLVPFLAVIGDLLVTDLKRHHVTEWLRNQTTWNATTQSDAAAEVKRAMQWAANEGRIDKNPIELLRMQRGASRDHVVSVSEYETLLAGVWKQKFARRMVTSFRMVLIALRLSGCRPSEIINAKIEDFDGSTWTIREHKNRKKTKRPRVIYLCPCLVTLTRAAARGRESGPIFLAADGRPWKYSDLRKRFERLRDKCDVTKKCVLYSFRHTWITNALLAGIDVATVAEMAGTSIEMIDRHYGHLNQQRDHMINAAGKVAVGRINQTTAAKVINAKVG